MVKITLYKNAIRKEKKLGELFKKAREYSLGDSLTKEEKAQGLLKLEQFMQAHPLRPSPFQSLLSKPKNLTSRFSRKIFPLSFRAKLNNFADSIINDYISFSYVRRISDKEVEK